MAAPKIVVLGSASMDIVAFVERAPEAGETLTGTGSKLGPGGKGSNQAIAAARLGADVTFIGSVGADAYGASLRAALGEAGADTSLLRGSDAPTGTAHIVVEHGGANRIVVVPGANGTLDGLTDCDRTAIAAADLLLLQLEVPFETVVEAARFGHQAGTRVVLTPAPSRELPAELLDAVDVLVPNEHEAVQVAGVLGVDEAIEALVARVPDVVVTLGEQGGIHAARGAERERFAAPVVEAVDTTAAGDTFVGALALGLGEGRPWPDALARASMAAAISVGRPGASESMPDAAELERALSHP
jgi:ribokinase